MLHNKYISNYYSAIFFIILTKIRRKLYKKWIFNCKKCYRLQSKTVEVLSFLKYNIEYFPKNATPSNSQANQQVLSENWSETESEDDPHES